MAVSLPRPPSGAWATGVCGPTYSDYIKYLMIAYYNLGDMYQYFQKYSQALDAYQNAMETGLQYYGEANE